MTHRFKFARSINGRCTSPHAVVSGVDFLKAGRSGSPLPHATRRGDLLKNPALWAFWPQVSGPGGGTETADSRRKKATG